MTFRFRICATAALLVAICAQADSFKVPYGFNGHSWGEPLQAFPGLRLWHANTVENSPGKSTDVRLNCQQAYFTGPQSPNGSTVGSTCASQISSFDQRIEGDGALALGEYYQQLDANPWADAGARPLTISYLYCAGTRGQYLPSPLHDHLQLCGARVIFLSDNLNQLAKRPESYLSNFDRIVRKLVADYGEPPGYELHGKITVQSLDESDDSAQVAAPSVRQEFMVYRWCGLLPGDQRLHPGCDASITLEFEANHGVGSVLFATAKVYDYAYARYVMGEHNNDLYALLFSRHLDHPMPRAEIHCTGTRICNAVHIKLDDATTSEFAQVTNRR